MLEWLAANIGTIIVALIVIAVIAFVVARMVKDKKDAPQAQRFLPVPDRNARPTP